MNLQIELIRDFSENVVIDYLTENDDIEYVGTIGDEEHGGDLLATWNFINELRQTKNGDIVFNILMGFNYEILDGDNTLMDNIGDYAAIKK